MKTQSGITAKVKDGRVWSAQYNLDGEWLTPHICPCCEKCWLIISGIRAGRCVHGGPYLGYVEIPDVWPIDQAGNS